MDKVLYNDVMNRVDCVIKRDVYPQKINSRFKNIPGISRKTYHRYYSMDIQIHTCS